MRKETIMKDFSILKKIKTLIYKASSRYYFKEICERYIKELNNCKLPNSPYQSNEHLKWMLVEILVNEDQSLTKKHRWLGYVQGILVANFVINVDNERNLTRNLFKGA